MSQDGGLKVRPVTFNVNVGYAKSVLGIIKIIEFFSLLISWASMADSVRYWSNPLYGGRVGFYLFVMIVGWLCIIFMAWFLLALSEKVKLPEGSGDGTVLVLCFQLIWAFLLLISCALVAKVADFFGVLAHHVGGDVLEKVYNTAVTSVVFGFFTIVLFVADIMILFLKIIKPRQQIGEASDNQQTA